MSGLVIDRQIGVFFSIHDLCYGREVFQHTVFLFERILDALGREEAVHGLVQVHLVIGPAYMRAIEKGKIAATDDVGILMKYCIQSIYS